MEFSQNLHSLPRVTIFRVFNIDQVDFFKNTKKLISEQLFISESENQIFNSLLKFIELKISYFIRVLKNGFNV